MAASALCERGASQPAVLVAAWREGGVTGGETHAVGRRLLRGAPARARLPGAAPT